MSDRDAFWQAVSSYESFLVTAHVRPDPDAIGSELALALFLEKLGKETRIVNEGPVPEAFTFLPQWERVLTQVPDGFEYEAVICLDAPNLARAGRVANMCDDVPVLIVDHHPYENGTAEVAWIDSAASSVGELLYDFMSQERELIDSEIATCLYAAIMTDTGRFSYSNTAPSTMAAAADLASLGAEPSRIARAYYENVSDGQLYLLGRAAAEMKRAGGGRVAWTVLTGEDFDQGGARSEEAQEIAELPRMLRGVVIGVLLREMEDRIKVSLRSKEGFDVKAAAEHFGGGGHHQAAAFFLETPLAEAEIEVIKFLEDYLESL